MPDSKHFAIVLAGGAGARLGLGIPKARAPLGDRTLLEHAVQIASRVAGEVVVVAPAGLDLGPCPARRIDDPPDAAGPLAGLVAGLAVANGRMAAVLGVDFPCVAPELLAWELDRLELASQWSVQAIVPRPGGVPQPLAAAIAADATPPLTRVVAQGQRSLRAGLAALSVEYVEDDTLERLPGGLAGLLNVNLPDDLDEARRRLARAPHRPRAWPQVTPRAERP